MCSLCLHCTPHSSSSSRHCAHSNIVFCARIQSSQNGGGCRRWAWDGNLTAPCRIHFFLVLNLVLRDGHITLGSCPGNYQTWSSIPYSLGQSNIIHLGRCLHIEIWNKADKTPFNDPSTHVHAFPHTISYKQTCVYVMVTTCYQVVW